MDDLRTWYEVIRSLLPQRYPMRMAWERRAIVIVSPSGGRVIRITETDLAGRTPTAVVRGVVRQLTAQHASAPA
jgi:hypothetical protein